jgi:hypothetical protein
MYSATGLSIEARLFLVTFSVIVPLIASSIGYGACKGKPKNLNREMYWTGFAAATVISGHETQELLSRFKVQFAKKREGNWGA